MLYLTRQERQVVLFLILVALLGLGINIFTKHFSQIKVTAYINQDFAKIDLNQADENCLISIPGIGRKLAHRIVDYRKESGNFNTLDELKNIKGIGKTKFHFIKDYLIIN